METIILSVIFFGQNRLNWSFRRRYWGQPTSSPEWSKGKSRELWKRMWLLCCRCYSLAVDKGGEIRDTKTFNLSLNIVSLQVLVDVSRFCLINLTRNKNICCVLKKCGALIGWFARARANLLRDKLWVWWKTSNKTKICCSSRPALYFAQQLSSTRNKCFCCATSWSRKVKHGKHRPKLATKRCWATSWRFLYLVFRHL